MRHYSNEEHKVNQAAKLQEMYIEKDICRDILLGIAVGDALGVPVEFKSRDVIAKKPVTDMMGYGTYHLPEGTFSDDSSLAFCLAEALTQPFSLSAIADNFIAWLYNNYWTPRERCSMWDSLQRRLLTGFSRVIRRKWPAVWGKMIMEMVR